MSIDTPRHTVTVVAIDDDRAILDLVELILTRHGFTVLTALNAPDGIELIAQHAPELVLLDYVMPGMDGLTAMREIKARFPDSYVIICTGRGNEEVAVEMMKGGASEYIPKPFNNRDLVERMENVLRIRHVELHNRALRQEREMLLLEIEAWNHELQNRVREKTEALNRARNEIAHSEKFAALGYLSAGMAHEIRNPLNSISLFVQLLKQSGDEAEQDEYHSRIIKEVDRIDLIIRKLLDASRRNRSITGDVRLEEVIDTALEVFSPQIEAHNIRVERTYRTPSVPIKADPAEAGQIFTNLFLNALDAMPDGGDLALEVVSEGGRVIARVGDSGGGIPDDVLPGIFEPFFTTKPRGTGMGLPVIQRIARLYGGAVDVERTSESGTVFRVEFPAS